MTENETIDILNQIKNRVILTSWVIAQDPPDAIRSTLCTLVEDTHQDSQRLIDALCVC